MVIGGYSVVLREALQRLAGQRSEFRAKARTHGGREPAQNLLVDRMSRPVRVFFAGFCGRRAQLALAKRFASARLFAAPNDKLSGLVAIETQSQEES